MCIRDRRKTPRIHSKRIPIAAAIRITRRRSRYRRAHGRLECWASICEAPHVRISKDNSIGPQLFRPGENPITQRVFAGILTGRNDAGDLHVSMIGLAL